MRKNFLHLSGSEESFLISKKDILSVSVKVTRESSGFFNVESKYFLREDHHFPAMAFEPGTYTSSTEQRESFVLTEKISSEKIAELKNKFGKDLSEQELGTMMILERLEER